MKTDYSLYIYEHDDRRAAVAIYESETPFLSFNVGDIINGRTLNHCNEKKSGCIDSIEHMMHIIEGSHITHQINIYIKPLTKA